MLIEKEIENIVMVMDSELGKMPKALINDCGFADSLKGEQKIVMKNNELFSLAPNVKINGEMI